jgi:hypothetical protein
MTYNCPSWVSNIDHYTLTNGGYDADELYSENRCGSFDEEGVYTVDRNGNFQDTDNGDVSEAACSDHEIRCHWLNEDRENYDFRSDLERVGHALCSDCDLVFVNIADLREHADEYHDGNTDYSQQYWPPARPAPITTHSAW